MSEEGKKDKLNEDLLEEVLEKLASSIVEIKEEKLEEDTFGEKDFSVSDNMLSFSDVGNSISGGFKKIGLDKFVGEDVIRKNRKGEKGGNIFIEEALEIAVGPRKLDSEEEEEEARGSNFYGTPAGNETSASGQDFYSTTGTLSGSNFYVGSEWAKEKSTRLSQDEIHNFGARRSMRGGKNVYEIDNSTGMPRSVQIRGISRDRADITREVRPVRNPRLEIEGIDSNDSGFRKFNARKNPSGATEYTSGYN